jgi:hypothetical protein
MPIVQIPKLYNISKPAQTINQIIIGSAQHSKALFFSKN